jgi:hypothetical protein
MLLVMLLISYVKSTLLLWYRDKPGRCAAQKRTRTGIPEKPPLLLLLQKLVCAAVLCALLQCCVYTQQYWEPYCSAVFTCSNTENLVAVQCIHAAILRALLQCCVYMQQYWEPCCSAVYTVYMQWFCVLFYSSVYTCSCEVCRALVLCIRLYCLTFVLCACVVCVLMCAVVF